MWEMISRHIPLFYWIAGIGVILPSILMGIADAVHKVYRKGKVLKRISSVVISAGLCSITGGIFWWLYLAKTGRVSEGSILYGLIGGGVLEAGMALIFPVFSRLGETYDYSIVGMIVGAFRCAWRGAAFRGEIGGDIVGVIGCVIGGVIGGVIVGAIGGAIGGVIGGVIAIPFSGIFTRIFSDFEKVKKIRTLESPRLNSYPHLFCEVHHLRAEKRKGKIGIFRYTYVVCRSCGISSHLVKGIKQVIGLIGSNIHQKIDGDRFYVNLWDNESKKARNADIDVLEIRN